MVDGLGWVCVIVRSVVRNHSASVLCVTMQLMRALARMTIRPLDLLNIMAIIIYSTLQSHYYLSVASSEICHYESRILPRNDPIPGADGCSHIIKAIAVKTPFSHSHLIVTSTATLEIFSNPQAIDNLHAFPKPDSGVIVPPSLFLPMLVLTIN